MKCNVCNLESLSDQNFTVVRRLFRGTRTYCPNCYLRRHRHLALAQFVALLIGGAIGLDILIRDHDSALGWILTNVFFFFACLAVSILPHEYAHAWAARLLGYEVKQIVVGLGPLIYSQRLLGVRVDLRQVPILGFCYAIPKKPEAPRIREFLFILAGPLANLVLAGLTFLIFRGDLPTLLMPTKPFEFARTFATANLWLAVINLLPCRIAMPDGPLDTDGLLMLKVLFPRWVAQSHSVRGKIEDSWSSLRRLEYWAGAVIFFLCGLYCLSLAIWLSSSLYSGEDGSALWFFGFLSLACSGAFGWFGYKDWRRPRALAGQPGQARTTEPCLDIHGVFNAELLSKSEWPAGISPSLLCGMLNRALSAKDLENARQLVDDGLRRAPQSLAFRYFRGSLFLEEGRYAEAEAAFAALLEQSKLNSATHLVLLSRRLIAIVHQSYFERARSLAEKYLAGPASAAEKLYLLDVLACVPFMHEVPGYLTEAEHWCNEAMSLQPGNLTLKGTQGALLAEQGRWKEAEQVLREVSAKSEADIDQGIAAFYLALAALRRGDSRHAKRLARRAQSLCAQPWLQKRIHAEFPALR